jgi:small subunit ribosomal protein S4e
VSDGTSAKGIPFLVTHDGRTIRYPDPLVKVHDTVKIDLESGKIVEFVKFEMGNTVLVTRGHNAGRVGVLVSRDRHPGSFDIVHVRDATGAVFATRLGNAFVIGKGADAAQAMVSLPRGRGIKRSIFDDRKAHA